MIIWVLGFLASFGNYCDAEPPPGVVLEDGECWSYWEGQEYDWDGDGAVTVMDLMDYLYYYNG